MTAQRYTAGAIVLHWAIAFAISFMIPLGLWMHEAAEHGDTSEAVFRAFQLHKSIGLTVLALSLARLGWRLAYKPPPLPAHMPAWERLAAKAAHWGFYALTIGLPLSGWLYVSAGWSAENNTPLPVPTYYFGLFRVPDLFGLRQAGEAVRAAAAEVAFTAHALMAYAMIALAALHAGAALKHHFYDRDEVLAHMVPGLKAPNESAPAPKNLARSLVLGAGFAAIALAGAAGFYALANLNPPAPAPALESQIDIVEPPRAAAEPPVEAPTDAAPWRVDAGASAIEFAFAYGEEGAGATRFTGRFTRWRADIRFDPDRLEQSFAVVTIETASASDGLQIHDQALPTAEWFDSANHPNAEFRTSAIRRLGPNRYEARGRLTIKGRTRDVILPFTLAIDGARASMNGRVRIDRTEFDIGVRSDADDAISREIDIVVRVEAARGP